VNGACVLSPYNCPVDNACTNNLCVVVAGKATCNVSAVSCANYPAPDACTPVICDNTIGCTTAPSNCNDGNPCTVDTCLGGSATNCSNVVPADVCGNAGACTINTCNSSMPTLALACQKTNVTCTPPNACQVVAGCNPASGCAFAPRVCEAPADFCLTSICDNQKGCLTAPRVCSVKDANCYTGVCDNVTATCSQVERPNFATITTNQKGGGTCFFVYNKKAVALLTAGAVAGIVIGAVVVAALLGFGGKKGYDYLMAHHSPIGQVDNNPLYSPSGGAGQNPTYKS